MSSCYSITATLKLLYPSNPAHQFQSNSANPGHNLSGIKFRLPYRVLGNPEDQALWLLLGVLPEVAAITRWKARYFISGNPLKAHGEGGAGKRTMKKQKAKKAFNFSTALVPVPAHGSSPEVSLGPDDA